MKDVKYSGVLDQELLATLPGVPDAARLELGALNAGHRGAITVEPGLTALPHLDSEKCNGCGLCIARCPGLSIFNVHKNYTETTSLVSFPYEYLPQPKVGDEVRCAGRDGLFLTMGTVHKVLSPAAYDHTTVVTVEVPKEFCMTVRTIQRGGFDK